jgi:uncharacterized membrane protein
VNEPRALRLDARLVATVALGAALRFWRLGAQSFWWDEFVTSLDVSSYLGDLLATLKKLEGSPPLYFFANWGAVKVFGTNDTGLRALSAIVGTATVPLVYLLTRELRCTRRTARIAALLVAVNPMLVWYSQEARPYALLAFLGAASLWACARAVRRRRPFDCVVWGVVAALTVATHYFGVFAVVPEAVWLTIALRHHWRRVALAVAPLAITVASLATYALAQRTQKQEWMRLWPVRVRVEEWARQFLLGPAHLDMRFTLVATACLAVAAGVLVVRGEPGERRTAATLVALAAGGVVLPLAFIALGSDYFVGHYVVASLTPLIVAAAIGFGARRARWPATLALVALCATSVGIVVHVANNRAVEKADYRTVAAAIAHGDAHQRAVMTGINATIMRYIPNTRVVSGGPPILLDAIDVLQVEPVHVRECGHFAGQACEQTWAPELPPEVARHFTVAERVRYAGFTLYRYRRSKPLAVRPQDFVDRARQENGLIVFDPATGPRAAPPTARRAR